MFSFFFANSRLFSKRKIAKIYRNRNKNTEKWIKLPVIRDVEGKKNARNVKTKTKTKYTKQKKINEITKKHNLITTSSSFYSYFHQVYWVKMKMWAICRLAVTIFTLALLAVVKWRVATFIWSEGEIFELQMATKNCL